MPFLSHPVLSKNNHINLEKMANQCAGRIWQANQAKQVAGCDKQAHFYKLNCACILQQTFFIISVHFVIIIHPTTIN